VQRQGQRQPRQPLRRRCAAAATTAATTATAAIAIILQLRFQSVMVTQNWITTIVLLVDLRLKVSESTLKATGKP
jgi:hypothetical protein